MAYKVSVLVPVYNVAGYLRACMDSIAAQDLADMEILCINDGSTDESLEILREYERKDSRVRIIDKPNTGYGNSMNLGLREAKGEYVGIVESDDFIEPDMFSCLYKAAMDNDADVVKSDFWIHVHGHDEYYSILLEPNWYEKVINTRDTFLIFERNPSIWSNLYRRQFLLDHDIWFTETPGASFQDIAFRVKVFACAERAYFLPKAFYHYRRDNEQASVRGDGKLFCVREEYAEAERFLKKREDWETIYQYLIWKLRAGHYWWNAFGRWLSFSSSHRFVRYMAEAFSEAEKGGLLRRKFWQPSNWLWNEFQNMIWDRRLFFYNHYAEQLRKDILLNGFLSQIPKERDIIIYGAGKVGQEVAVNLQKRNIRVKCFAVSEREGNEPTVLGLSVHPIDELRGQKESATVLVAVKQADQPEIVDRLFDEGFLHVVAMIPEARQAIR